MNCHRSGFPLRRCPEEDHLDTAFRTSEPDNVVVWMAVNREF